MISKRVQLGEAVPLETPFSLYIFPTYFCNFKCNYCEHSLPENELEKLNYYKQVMDFHIFEKAINDAKYFPQKIKSIAFVGAGEPLLHPRIADMVKLAVDNQIAERVEIITNGSLLSHDMADSLISAGLQRLRISIQGLSAERYQKVCNVSIDFDKLVSQIQYFFNNKRNTDVYIKIIDCALNNEHEKDEFIRIFTPICDDICIEPLINFFDNVPFKAEDEKQSNCLHGGILDSAICPQPFYMVYLLPDGTIAPCNAVGNKEIYLGNIQENSLCDIWKSNKRKNFLLSQLDGYKSLASCKNCNTILCAYSPEDKLDDYRDRIQKKLLGRVK